MKKIFTLLALIISFSMVMTILTVGFTAIKFPTFRKLDLTKDMNENNGIWNNCKWSTIILQQWDIFAT